MYHRVNKHGRRRNGIARSDLTDDSSSPSASDGHPRQFLRADSPLLEPGLLDTQEDDDEGKDDEESRGKAMTRWQQLQRPFLVDGSHLGTTIV